ncbi:helix-turn-helix domain-containing protein [Nonomuraea sp. NPDC046802]|uniref:TetR/AcrR family transcriptional regulator n=1 Tax=Nonomuraea sp. NPDC046802 TaxID=3154919 RepID=UPI0033E00A50
MRADARRNYDRLVETARHAFAERGTEASLEDIAKTAGVGIGTLYRHFPTRQTLLREVLRDGMAAIQDKGRQVLEGPAAPVDALAEWLRALIRHTATFRGLSAEIMGGLREESSEFSEACGLMEAIGAELLTRAQATGAVRADVGPDDLIKLVSAMAWLSEQGEDDTGRLVGIMLDGLRAVSS